MYQTLAPLRVIEASSYVAAPSAGLYLSQMGAEVIRIDQIGGGPDFNRWPRSQGGSLFWEGLNRGKKSVALDLGHPEGREIAQRLVTAPGPDAGLFLTNFPERGFLAHERLAAMREDLVTLRIMGWPDGATAVDYTINAAVGIPALTGPAESDAPVNHVLPAWDLLTGAMAALNLVAAERQRRETGVGGETRLPLSDVAITTLANLGMIGELAATGQDRPRYGNDLFGALGRDFVTADGQRLIVVGLTGRQWQALVSTLGIEEAVAQVEDDIGQSLARDEGLRFAHRHQLNPVIAAAVSARSMAELAVAFEGTGVCWAPYRNLSEAMATEPRLVSQNPVFAELTHPSGLSYPAPGLAATIMAQSRDLPRPAPQLGADTEQVLAEILCCGATEIADLHDRGIVASPSLSH